MEEFLTTRDIARILKVHVVTVRRWIVNKKLPATFLGKEFRISEQDFEKFLSDRKIKK